VDQINQFINDPLVAGVYGILVLSLVDLILAIYRSIQGRVFDWTKLPQILDSVVLQKVIPLAALGVASFFVTDQTTKGALVVAYTGLAASVLAAEVRAIIAKVTGAYEPTTVAQDRAN
jgi:hypothetical protein